MTSCYNCGLDLHLQMMRNKTHTGKTICAFCWISHSCDTDDEAYGSNGCTRSEINDHMKTFRYCEPCLIAKVAKYSTREQKLNFLATCSREQQLQEWNSFCSNVRNSERAAKRQNDTFANALLSMPIMGKLGLSF